MAISRFISSAAKQVTRTSKSGYGHASKRLVRKKRANRTRPGGGYKQAEGRKGTALHKNPSNRKRVLKRIERDTLFTDKPAKTRKGRKDRTRIKNFLNRDNQVVPKDKKKKTPFRGRN